MIESLIIVLVDLVGWKAAAGIVLFVPMVVPVVAFSLASAFKMEQL